MLIETSALEDRHLVQRLLHCHDALLRLHPFAKHLDYNQPVRCLAIAPRFGTENLLDRRYCNLEIEFWTVSLVRDHALVLRLEQVDTGLVLQTPVVADLIDGRATELPRALADLLLCSSNAERALVMRVREHLLGTHPLLQEVVLPKAVHYRRGHHYPLVEIRLTGTAHPELHLWLPEVVMAETGPPMARAVLVRMRVWVGGTRVLGLVQAPQQLVARKPKDPFKGPFWSDGAERGRTMFFTSGNLAPRRPLAPLSDYGQALGVGGSPSLEGLLDVALARWLARVEQRYASKLRTQSD